MIAFSKPSATPSEAGRQCRTGRRGQLALLAACVALLAGCGARQKVERRQGDHVELGRRVPPSAYAWYARARYLHRLGELESAREAYDAVLDADPRSGSAWAGLGSTYCASDPKQARWTFSTGLKRATEQVPIYLARGRCELDWGKPAAAVASARLAFLLDPSATESSALLATALSAGGRTDEAARIERGYRLYRGAGQRSPARMAGQAGVDLALARGEFALAEALSLEIMTRSSLAVRALAIGKREYAAEQAALVLAASPDDRTAWAVLSLTRGGQTAPEGRGSGVGELLACLWTEHLRAETGAASAGVFLGAFAGAGAQSNLEAWRAASDPLLQACARRLGGNPATAPGGTAAPPVVAQRPTTSARP